MSKTVFEKVKSISLHNNDMGEGEKGVVIHLINGKCLIIDEGFSKFFYSSVRHYLEVLGTHLGFQPLSSKNAFYDAQKHWDKYDPEFSRLVNVTNSKIHFDDFIINKLDNAMIAPAEFTSSKPDSLHHGDSYYFSMYKVRHFIEQLDI